MHKQQYDEWLAGEQAKITRSKKQTMLSELDTAILQRAPRTPGQRTSTAKGRTERLIEQRMSDIESSSDLVGACAWRNGRPPHPIKNTCTRGSCVLNSINIRHNYIYRCVSNVRVKTASRAPFVLLVNVRVCVTGKSSVYTSRA
jgi:hypothetical protein